MMQKPISEHHTASSPINVAIRFALRNVIKMLNKPVQIFFSVVFAFLFVVCAPANSSEASLSLTPQEQEWITHHKTIRLSGPQAFPPFQYFSDDGTFQGMASDYIYLIADMVGLQVEVAEQQLWPAILKKLQNKEIDVLSCAAKSPERESYLAYTTPHLSFPLIIVCRKDAPFIGNIKSLHNMRIAFVKKNAGYDWVKEEGIDFTPIFVNSPLEALEAISLDKADAMIENLAAASYLIEKNGLTNLKIAALTSYIDYALSIAVRKDWPELVTIFNKALAAIPTEKHNEIRQKWISVRYEHGIRAKDIIQWSVTAGAAALLLFSSFFFWNRKLQREIEVRRQTEREKEELIATLSNALNEIRTLRGILPICSECKKIRDDSGYWTQIESYIEKHSEADFSHSLCPDCTFKIYGKERWFKPSMLPDNPEDKEKSDFNPKDKGN